VILFAAPAYAQTPPEAQRLLDGGSVVSDVAGWQFGDLAEWIWQIATKEIRQPFRFAAEAVIYLLLACLVGVLAVSPGWQRCLDAISVLGFGAMSLSAMVDLARSVSETAGQCQTYLINFVPVFSGVAAMGGQNAGAAVYSGMFLAMAGFLSGAIQNLLLPVLEIYFCFCICAAVWGDSGIVEAAGLLGRCVAWLLKGCGALFSFVLGLQNILANNVDSAALRLGQGFLQGAIPVVGDTAAAALQSAGAAVQLLKGSLALAAVGVLGASFLPVFLHCLLYTAAFYLVGIFATAGGQRQCGQICRLYAGGAKLCGSILVLYFFMVFLSTSLLLITGNGGGI